MAYAKLVKMVRALEQQTNRQRVEWQETGDEGVFQANFPGHSVRVLTRQIDPDTDYVIQIFNANGALVEEATDVDLRDPELPLQQSARETFELMRSLYDGARRQAMGVDRALDEILQNLEDDVQF